MSRRARGCGLALLVASVLGAPGYTVAQEFQATPLEPDTRYSLNLRGKHRRGMTSVLVKLDAAALASYEGGVPGLAATAPRRTGRRLDVNSPESRAYLRHFRGRQEAFQAACHSSIPGAVVTHSLPLIFGGVAMVVPDEAVADVAKLPGVERVYADELLQLDTDASPRFIGAPEALERARRPRERRRGNRGRRARLGRLARAPVVLGPGPLGEALRGASRPAGPGSRASSAAGWWATTPSAATTS